MGAREIFLLLLPARGGDAVDLPERRPAALERQEAGRDEEIDPALQKTLHPVVVVLQEERGQELQLHLLAGRVFKLIDAQEWIVAMRAPVLPIRGREAEHRVTLCRPVAGRGLEALSLHIEHDRRALPGQQVRNDKAGGLAAPGRGHDQRVREGPGAEERCTGSGLAQFPDDKARARRAEEAVPLHLPAGLPMGIAEAGEGRARHRKAHHEARHPCPAHDQVDQAKVIGADGPDGTVVLHDVEEIDLSPETQVPERHDSRGDDIADRDSDQCDQRDAEGEAALPHPSHQCVSPRSASPSTRSARWSSNSRSAISSTTARVASLLAVAASDCR